MNFWKKDGVRGSIRYAIFFYFTISALVAILLIGVSLYTRMANQLTATIQEENQSIIGQMGRTVDSYLRTLMKLSDSLYYGAIKNMDLSESLLNREFTLLYDNNKDHVEGIALFSGDGELLEAVPAARLKPGVDVTKEAWFTDALARTENLHFGTPKVQYIFDNSEGQYRWVYSISRSVELTEGAKTDQGVLLIDVRYDSLEQLFENVVLGNGGYTYLIDSGGEILYHPRMQLIDSGIVMEDNRTAAALRDGTVNGEFQGAKRMTTVKSVGYTGWKIVGVTPEPSLSLNSIKSKLFVVFVVAFFVFILAIINAYISSKITVPIKMLESSVKTIEAGDLDAPVYIGGTYEIHQLGESVQRMNDRIKLLMQDIVREHESKRKTEFDVLQSQINPHFLYNTLDIIVWMIENEQQTEAVRIVTALARFFRISLSRGRSIIPVRDELEHVRSYLTIQGMRFKNRFTYEITADEDVMDLASLKLILQPMVENAIYHGMEFMDGDGEIEVRAFREGDDLYLTVRDNGFGMTREQVENLLHGCRPVKSSGGKGSGIGVRNVSERIKLYFGEDYGLRIESEPDEGTTVIIHLPAVSYEEAGRMEKK